ncbi:MAG: sigma-70 family RNA polymerase sigma factor, partial [Ginsengibacter sp.]
EAGNDLENKEIQQYFHRAVNTLTSQQSLVYKLSREEGMKHHEIAELLNISPHTVKNHISLALRTIGEYMQKNLKAEYLTIFILLAFVQ